MKTNIKMAALIVLIFILVVSLGACKNKTPAAENDGAGSGADVVEEEGDTPDPEPSDSGQDLSGVADQADWLPAFPEFEDSITWTAVPRDYIGGLGTQVGPKPDNKGYVNVREKPSIKAKVIGEIHHNADIPWIVIDEFYQKDGQLFVGSYKVKSDDYTWLPVEGVDPGTGKTVRGWAAMEVLELWAI